MNIENKSRGISRLIEPEPVIEGAGVHLRRSIATRTLNYLDPFLLLDHFAGSDRRDYEAGFPMHPHRGIETVTYMLTGAVQHRDTLGNSGVIGAGDIQWMTSGGGIMHEEMPQVRPEGIDGFQLWVNLPAKSKMSKPRYQDIRSNQVPVVQKADGAMVRVVAGIVDGTTGPVTGIAADPIYMDITVPPHSRFIQPVEKGHSAFSYVFEGKANFVSQDGPVVAKTRMIVWEDGDSVQAYTGNEPVRFLLVSGKPLNEPVARYGPFVMNTREEIEQALADLRQGTFIRN